MLLEQADLFAPLLSRSVRLLRLVQRERAGGSWRSYRIVRVDDAVNVYQTDCTYDNSLDRDSIVGVQADGIVDQEPPVDHGIATPGKRVGSIVPGRRLDARLPLRVQL